MSQFQYTQPGTAIEKSRRLATFGLFKNGRQKISTIVQSKYATLPDEAYGTGACDQSKEQTAPCEFDPLIDYIPKCSITIYNSNVTTKLAQDEVSFGLSKQLTERKHTTRNFIKINRQRFKPRTAAKYECHSPHNSTAASSNSCEHTLINPQLSDSVSSNGSQSFKILNSFKSFKTDRSPKPGDVAGNNKTYLSATSTPTGSSKSGSVFHSPTSLMSSNRREVAHGAKRIKAKTGTTAKNSTGRRNRPYLLQKQSQEYTEKLSKLWYPKQTSSMSMNISVTSSENINDCDE
ncbi:unnamed protein product [Allacma fusca]|uniref:Uncharacterized protein n=1 Tax=Allacma fusca TaxID=39272 RepID=A0A8J2P6B4_9HEXA|nr:unnamed protein product [Allacma fusca]